MLTLRVNGCPPRSRPNLINLCFLCCLQRLMHEGANEPSGRGGPHRFRLMRKPCAASCSISSLISGTNISIVRLRNSGSGGSAEDCPIAMPGRKKEGPAWRGCETGRLSRFRKPRGRRRGTKPRGSTVCYRCRRPVQERAGYRSGLCKGAAIRRYPRDLHRTYRRGVAGGGV